MSVFFCIFFLLRSFISSHSFLFVFRNDNVEKSLESYRKAFDIVYLVSHIHILCLNIMDLSESPDFFLLKQRFCCFFVGLKRMMRLCGELWRLLLSYLQQKKVNCNA